MPLVSDDENELEDILRRLPEDDPTYGLLIGMTEEVHQEHGEKETQKRKRAKTSKASKKKKQHVDKGKGKSKRARVSTASLNKYSILPEADQVSFPFCPDDLTNSVSLIEFIILLTGNGAANMLG